MKNTWAIVSLFLVIAVGVLGFLFFQQKQELRITTQELNTVTAEMEFEKQQSMEEFEEMARQYEDFYIKTDNDSLLKQFEEEKQKVQQLLQELKTVKATDAHRISELKKELTTVRGVLQSYIVKVDSLNAVNVALTEENTAVRKQYEQAAETARQWEEKSLELEGKVTLASMLEAGNISIELLDEKGKPCKRRKTVTKFALHFEIRRNITSERGVKLVYVRIADPSEHLMPAAREEKFPFEGQNLACSCFKSIEYGGEDTPVTLYYPLTGELAVGTYTVTIFCEGNIIGSMGFTIQ